TAALAELAGGERGEEEANRNVQPEDPLPGRALDDRAADERAKRDCKAADPTPGAQREPALFRRHRCAEQGQRERRNDRAATALQGTRGDEDINRWCQRRDGGAEREQ